MTDPPTPDGPRAPDGVRPTSEGAPGGSGPPAPGGARAPAAPSSPAPTPAPREQLSRLRKAVYALGDHTVNAALASLSFHYLFFLTEVVGLRPALAGLVPWVGRIVDAVTDPVMGRLSDRTTWRMGRRRPFFLIGAIPFGVSFAMLWMEAPASTDLGRFAYYASAYVLFSISMTVLSVPYLALIPEMAFDYQGRTSLNSYRAAGAMLGAFVAVGLRMTAEGAGGGARGFAAAGALYAVWFALPWLAVYAVSFERPGFRTGAQVPLRQALRMLVEHRAYGFLALLYLCSRLAVDIVMAMLIFYFTYWIGRPGDFEISMFLLLATVVLALPVWLRISEGADKKTLFVAGCCIWMVTQSCFLLATPEWPRLLVFAIAVLAGVAYAAVEVMPWSMLGDVVDEDELESGERREGLYAGSFMFLRKLGGPTGVLLLGVGLDATGFRPNGEQPPSALAAIRLLTGLAPLVFIALAAWFASRYPLSRAAHARIRAALLQRHPNAGQ